jgi:hypothetical protein
VRQQQCGGRAAAPHRWSARLMLVLRAVKEQGMWLSRQRRTHARRGPSPLVCTSYACPASSDGARHVVIRLWFGERGRGGRMRAAMPRGRNSQLNARSTCWQQPRARAPQRSRGQAHRDLALGTPPSRCDHDLGGKGTACQSITSLKQCATFEHSHSNVHHFKEKIA